jgi:cobyrinic acid a,c-diamide synthase
MLPTPSEKPQFLLAAPSSGSGKTTLTLGLLRALARRGLVVQPFKCGPDYLDTHHHTQAAGRPSLNLDLFMASVGHTQSTYAHYTAPADVAVVEGVMGLFDGADRMRGSAADVAEQLGIPVILVVNAKAMAYSVWVQEFLPRHPAGRGYFQLREHGLALPLSARGVRRRGCRAARLSP